MNRIDRLQAILIQLQTKKVVKAYEIADRFEISLRTVYRDIRALEEGGVPIGAEAGYGYYLLDGYHLPPIMFTREEAIALLVAEKFMQKHTDRKSQDNFISALSKIKAVLDKEKKEEIEALNSQIVVDPFGMQFRDQTQNILLSKIQEALPRQRVIKMNYWTNYKGEYNEREVEPIGICFYSSQWHLIAWCRLRKDYRDFRIDRIEKLDILDERYDKSKHMSLGKYLESLQRDTDLVLVKVEIDKDISRYLQDSKYQYGWVSEEEKGDVVEMSFAAFSIEHIARWFLMIGNHIKILEPEPLKAKMKMLVKELGEHYS